jgi:RNA polymerase sigma-70 factor (ECF subfamily)
LRHDRSKKIMNATDQFEALVREYYEPLFRFALSLTRAECDAQDLTQHTFYVWATKGHQLRDLAKIKTWLFTTLHRAFLQARRRQARFPSHEWEEASEELPACSPVLPDEGEAAQVLSALAELDEVYQAAVALFYLDDCSYKDIAAVLEVPVGTVKSRIARGIAQLRDILLSGSSRVASRDEDRTAFVAGAPKPGARPEGTVPASSLPLQLAAGACERVSAEWNFSSTVLQEALARA